MPRTPVANPSLPIAPLRGLLEVTRLLRAEGELPEVLDCDRTHDRRVPRVRHGRDQPLPAGVGRLLTSRRARQPGAREALLGRVRPLADWKELLDDRFCQPRRVSSSPRARSSGTSSGELLARRPTPADPTPGIPTTGSSSCSATQAGTCSASSPSTSPQTAAARPTTTSTSSSRSATHRARPARRAGGRGAAKHRRALEELLAVSSGLSERDARRTRSSRASATRIRAPSASRTSASPSSTSDGAHILPQASVGWQLDDATSAGRPLARRARASARPCVRAGGMLPASRTTRRAAGSATWRSRGPRNSTAAGRGPGTATCCSCRCTTATARRAA